VRVTVGGEPYLARMPADSTLDELKRKRAQLEAHGRTRTPRAGRGTLAAEARRYIALIKHLESWKARQAHLKAWITLYGVFASTVRHSTGEPGPHDLP
jgi:hypothetical protein